MLSLEACRKILNKNGENYSDEEIILIRDFLQELIEIEFYRSTTPKHSKEPVKQIPKNRGYDRT